MNNEIKEADLSPVNIQSLLEYTPHKFLTLSTLPIRLVVKASDEPLPNSTDASSKNEQRSSGGLRKLSKAASIFRYFIPITRTDVPSITDNQYSDSQLKPVDKCDLRIFIIRHAERVDRYFGPQWYMLAFNDLNQYQPYHENLPPYLPTRENKLFWAIDTPLTVSGLKAAKALGQKLSLNNCRPDYVYSSPAMRCVLTTIQILKGLRLEKKLPIRIEPGLLEFGAAHYGMNVFLKPRDWSKYGVNVDLSYQPIMKHVEPFEQESFYYLRSKYVIRSIERFHRDNTTEPISILVIAHATSPDTLTWDLFGKQPNVNDLYRLSLNIAYLQVVTIERKKDNKSWSLQSAH